MLSNHSLCLCATALVADPVPLVEVSQAVGTKLDSMRIPEEVASLPDRQERHFF